MSSNWTDISIALAGLLQACMQVEKIAKTGYVQSEQFETSVNSLFITEPKSCIEVFGSVAAIEDGLEKLDELLTHYRRSPSTDLFRYVLGVMHIQKRLASKAKVLTVIGERLDKLHTQVEHFGAAHDNTVGSIADIYSDTISKFQYRIQVTGNYDYLQQARVANQVRTLLLAAIRASTLWRQVGGTRIQFLIKRKQILNECHELIKQAKTERLRH